MRWSSRKDGSGEPEWYVETRGYEMETNQRETRRKARRRIYEVLRHYGFSGYKGSGSNSIKCPFHDDRHNSAMVNWSSGYFTCFACDVHGTAIDLVMTKEGLGLDDAARFILLLS